MFDGATMSSVPSLSAANCLRARPRLAQCWCRTRRHLSMTLLGACLRFGVATGAAGVMPGDVEERPGFRQDTARGGANLGRRAHWQSEAITRAWQRICALPDAT